jgi:tetratricopeptide (TPR) repeat protein
MEQYLATNPKNPGLHWAALGEYLLASKNTDKARQAIEKALRADPYSYWAHFRLALLYERENRKPEAIERYEFLARFAFDRDPDVYLNLAALYRATGRDADALALLKTGLRMFPSDVNIYRLYRELGGV